MSVSPDLDDNRLGAALGNSLRDRVDDIPTITPGFDGIERRARQITNRRRALAGVAVGAFLLLGGFGVATLIDDDSVADVETDFADPDRADPDRADPNNADPNNADPNNADATPPATAAPAEPDPLPQTFAEIVGDLTAVRNNQEFVRINTDGSEEVLYTAAQADISDAVLLEDGSVLIEHGDSPTTRSATVLYVPADGSEPTTLAEASVLTGGAVIDGTGYAFIGAIPDFSTGVTFDDQQTGDLLQVALTDGFPSTVLMEAAFGIEWSVSRVDYQNDRYLVDGSSEAGPAMAILDASGERLDFTLPDSDPAGEDGLEPPYFTNVHLNDLGTGLWWLELPNIDRTNDGWVLDGPARLRSELFDPELMQGEDVQLAFEPTPGGPGFDLEREGPTFLVNVYYFDEELGQQVWLAPILIETFADPVVTQTDLLPGHYSFAPGT